jgi:hypothetical protein
MQSIIEAICPQLPFGGMRRRNLRQIAVRRGSRKIGDLHPPDGGCDVSLPSVQ